MQIQVLADVKLDILLEDCSTPSYSGVPDTFIFPVKELVQACYMLAAVRNSLQLYRKNQTTLTNRLSRKQGSAAGAVLPGTRDSSACIHGACVAQEPAP